MATLIKKKRIQRPKKKAIRKRLVQLCKKLGWSQEKFGKQMGKSRNAAEAWFKREGKNIVPLVDVFIALGRDHDVNLNWLLLGKGQPFRRKPKSKSQKSSPRADRPQSDAVAVALAPPPQESSVLPQADPTSKKNSSAGN